MKINIGNYTVKFRKSDITVLSIIVIMLVACITIMFCLKSIHEKENIIENKERSITNLVEDKHGLELQVDDLNRQITDLKQENQDLESKIDDLSGQVYDLKHASTLNTSVSIPSINQVCGPLPSVSLSAVDYSKVRAQYSTCSNDYFKKYIGA